MLAAVRSVTSGPDILGLLVDKAVVGLHIEIEAREQKWVEGRQEEVDIRQVSQARARN